MITANSLLFKPIPEEKDKTNFVRITTGYNNHRKTHYFEVIIGNAVYRQTSLVERATISLAKEEMFLRLSPTKSSGRKLTYRGKGRGLLLEGRLLNHLGNLQKEKARVITNYEIMPDGSLIIDYSPLRAP